jgi:hypothetical protein
MNSVVGFIHRPIETLLLGKRRTADSGHNPATTTVAIIAAN